MCSVSTKPFYLYLRADAYVYIYTYVCMLELELKCYNHLGGYMILIFFADDELVFVM